MKKKILVYILLIIIWLLVIYLFSNANSNSSNKLSHGITYDLIEFTNKIKLTNIQENDKHATMLKLNKVVRKIAHMSEYFILSIFIYFLLKSLNINKYILIKVLLICFICALIDEYHQTFVSGRTGQFIDCIIDLTGSCIFTLIVKIKKNIKKM